MASHIQKGYTMNKELFDKGMAIRRQVAGDKAIDAAMAGADEFSMPMQELVTEFCWGAVWTRPGLDLRSRSILNLGMVVALNRPDELGLRHPAGLSFSERHRS